MNYVALLTLLACAGVLTLAGEVDPVADATEVHARVVADTRSCAVAPPADWLALEQQIGSSFAAPDKGQLYRIVNRMHIIRRTDGTGGLPVHLVDYLMRDLNHGFRDTPFRFVREPEIVYIDNDVYYDDLPNLTIINFLYNQRYHGGVINWFFTPSIFEGQFVGYTSPGGTSSAAKRGQILINSSVGRPTNIVTPPHEMGHVFFLYHPFENRFGLECTSQSNCATAGDLLCDTPPSPCLHSGNTTGLGVFFGSDPLPCAGDPPWAPEARLYMDCGWPAGHILRDRFSPDQLERMESTLFSISSDLLSLAPDVLVDCDGNGVDDLDEIQAGQKVDLGEDMVPDVCQTFPAPGDLLVSGMNTGPYNRPRFYDGTTGAWRGDMWNGLSWVHQMRFGPDGYVYLASLSLITRMDVRTARNVDVVLDGVLDGAGTFVDLLFDDDGSLLVLDNVSANIRRYSPEGQFLGVFANVAGVGMTSPKYMEYGPDGHVYVVGNGALGSTIQRFRGDVGSPLGSLIPSGSGGLVAGQGITFHEGVWYVSNGGANNVLRFAPSGAFLGVFVTNGSGGLNNPHSLRFGADGHLYVASRGTHSVKRYDGDTGAYMGNFVAQGSGGPAETGGLDQPAGLLFCSAAEPVTDLRLDREGDAHSGGTRLSWTMPDSEAPLLRFDVLVATAPDRFDEATCLEADGTDSEAVDLVTPAPGGLRFFLVRSKNVCGATPPTNPNGGPAQSVATCG